jgi:hypothetical protein
VVTKTTAAAETSGAEGRLLASPLGWSVMRRLGWAMAACAVLWLAVLWALS